MILIIDYGMGNLRSVERALECVGAKTRVSGLPQDVVRADKIVFPGVGSFRDGVTELTRRNLLNPIITAIRDKKPFLGLCLGFQLLFSGSEEGGSIKGFDVLEGNIRRFPETRGLKIPHMGWNEIRFQNIAGRKKCPILNGISDGTYMYFVHSYFVDFSDKHIIAATTDYGVTFPSLIWKDNIYATQFHPEKSQKWGLKILENFAFL